MLSKQQVDGVTEPQSFATGLLALPMLQMRLPEYACVWRDQAVRYCEAGASALRQANFRC
jgi:hypothetical protein